MARINSALLVPPSCTATAPPIWPNLGCKMEPLPWEISLRDRSPALDLLTSFVEWRTSHLLTTTTTSTPVNCLDLQRTVYLFVDKRLTTLLLLGIGRSTSLTCRLRELICSVAKPRPNVEEITPPIQPLDARRTRTYSSRAITGKSVIRALLRSGQSLS